MLLPELSHGKLWKYAKPEFERRFLLEQPPAGLEALRHKDIEDKYLDGTRLRIRRTSENTDVQYKLTKKLDLADEAANWISTIYLSEAEYALFDTLVGVSYKKRRHYIEDRGEQTIGIDEIQTQAGQIWLAEVEFASEKEMKLYRFPLSFEQEVTEEAHYSGFEIAKRAIP